MLRPIVICGLLTLFASSSVFAQSNRTSATSSSAVNSSRTTSSSSSRTAGANTASLGEFQPIDRGGFVGRNQDAGFVGRSSTTGTGTGMAGMGRSGMSGMGMGMGMGGMGMGGMGSRGMNSQFGQQNNSQNQKSNIRATVKVRFPYTRPPAAQVSRAVTARWNRLPMPEKFNGISMNFENGVATLTGKVTTPEDKRMAEKLILLEPGVSSVQNQLEVVAAEESK
jgi:osmotically-inducible protein OsmY